MCWVSQAGVGVAGSGLMRTSAGLRAALAEAGETIDRLEQQLRRHPHGKLELHANLKAARAQAARLDLQLRRAVMEERPPARPVTAEDRLQRRRRLGELVERRDALEEEARALEKEHGGMLRRSKDPRPPHPPPPHLALTPAARGSWLCWRS